MAHRDTALSVAIHPTLTVIAQLSTALQCRWSASCGRSPSAKPTRVATFSKFSLSVRSESHKPMSVSKATTPPNQIAFDFMSENELAIERGPIPARRPSQDVAWGGAQFSMPISIMGAILAAAVVLVYSLVSGATAPVLLTSLSTLAILGLFFVFGTLAGHIRVGERVSLDDLAVGITETIDRGVLIAERGGRILFANARLEDLTGPLGARDIVALDMAVGANPAAREAMFRLSRAAERGDRHREEIRFEGSGTPARVLVVDVCPFLCARIAKGEPLTMWTIWDATEERARETESRKSLNDLLAHYDAAPVGLAMVDPGGTIRHMNATLARQLGFPIRSLQERILRVSDLLAGDGAERLDAACQSAAADRIVLDVDVTREDGRLMPVRVLVRAARDGTRVLAITSRDRDAAQTGEMFLDAPVHGDARFQRLFQSAPFGIASVSADGRISSFNGAFARLILDASGGIGKLAIDVLARTEDSRNREALGENLKRVLAGKASAQPIETSLTPEHVRRIYLSPLVEQANEREAAIVYVIDATEQKALEAQFAQSSKMEAVGQLAGGIAHDFNNVLTAIIGFSDLLLQTHRTSDPSYKDIKSIQQSAYRAAGMVRQLLSFSRRQTFQEEPLLLDDILNENVTMLRSTLGEKITLKLHPSRDLWHVNVDRNQIARVIVNLTVNARDAMPDGGTLQFTTRNVTERESQRIRADGMPIGEYVLLEISDTGTGMPPEVLEKIFEPFFTTKGVGKGTGLGLSTVYGIVKQSGGYIYVDSILGRGTTFRVYLPRHHIEPEEDLAPDAVADAKRQDDRPDRPTNLTGNARVLIVEDEDIVRAFTVRGLTRLGYEVLEAADGIEALDIVAAGGETIDLVVTDVVMPEMDGPTLFKQLRKTNPSLKVIFVSGYPNEAFRETLGSEDVAFLPKPFSLEQLAAKVKEELNR